MPIKKNFENLLMILADNLERLCKASVNMSGLWYNDYYYEMQEKIRGKKERKKIYAQIYHLKKFGYIDKKGFTQKGLERVFKIKKSIEKECQKWDKKWRIVIFDIPEKKKELRNYFRNKLIELNFKKMQNSVWVNPHDDFKEIQDIIKNCNIEKFVIFMIVDKISNDLLFKKKFNL